MAQICQFGQISFSKGYAFHTLFLPLPSLFLTCCLSLIYIILCHETAVEAYPPGTIKHTVKLRKILENSISPTEPAKGKGLWNTMKN